MITSIRGAALLFASMLAGAPGPAIAADDGFAVAVTVDDLPAHGPLPRGLTRAAIAGAYAGTLRAHGVPEAFGFVNARGLADEPDSAAALALWRAAGYPLGNHTYGHLGLSQAPSLDAWTDDVARNEPALAARMGAGDWHWLRYPFLDAGAGPRHDGALAWLQRRGYRIADVTLGFDDWAYSAPYARCLDKGDAVAIAAMRDGFLRRVDQQIARSKALSRRVYGRVIPQVLLTHVGAWSAATLPQVLARLDAAGAHYVTLAQAQADAAYRDTGPRSGNGALMERRAGELGVDTAGLPEVEPVAPLDGVCR
ncbi:polysaccharide deacetylase family protein [uncultured Massilia sp.]|uniref:polysaccharide deacetylase family protein n=1 Tax=uncultured Massilia sp. TaxID=169973 RepID=UPI0025F15DC4|nr:polysaccharide deacetylase family protein [uncultured Massilia sp.]